MEPETLVCTKFLDDGETKVGGRGRRVHPQVRVTGGMIRLLFGFCEHGILGTSATRTASINVQNEGAEELQGLVYSGVLCREGVVLYFVGRMYMCVFVSEYGAKYTDVGHESSRSVSLPEV